MIEQLFGSKTRVKLLRLFYSNPNRSFYVREITRKVDEQINSVRRELANLLNIGIISSDTNNNRLYYEVNQKFEHYKPLASIFGGVKFGAATDSDTPAAADEDLGELKVLGNVELAVITGQFTRDETSGVDFVVVGDINQTQLTKYIAELEKREGKELRYTAMTLDEFKYRRKVHDRFLSLLEDSKNQILVDKSYLMTPAPKAKPANAEETKKKKAK